MSNPLSTRTFPKRVLKIRPNPKFNCPVFLLLQPHDPDHPWMQGQQFTIKTGKADIEAEVIDAWGANHLMGISSGLLALCSGIPNYKEAIDLYHNHYTRKGLDLSKTRFHMLICKRN